MLSLPLSLCLSPVSQPPPSNAQDKRPRPGPYTDYFGGRSGEGAHHSVLRIAVRCENSVSCRDGEHVEVLTRYFLYFPRSKPHSKTRAELLNVSAFMLSFSSRLRVAHCSLCETYLRADICLLMLILQMRSWESAYRALSSLPCGAPAPHRVRVCATCAGANGTGSSACRAASSACPAATST